ncbi:unannotated protein [freshwater metagenome]|uniref:Unannotated protein n=1 Tax=freshwater metagenome TaxID=449393 RepID=A0A6J7TKU5_9ZZZZ
MSVPPGIFKYPKSLASAILRTMDRPTNATLRLFFVATSITCWTRCTCEANEATITRPVAPLITCCKVGMMSFSLVTNPGTSAFVESTRNKSTPLSPRRAKAFKSVTRPSSGNWSILKSPVIKIVPAGVVTATANASGIEWFTAINSTVNSP